MRRTVHSAGRNGDERLKLIFIDQIQWRPEGGCICSVYMGACDFANGKLLSVLVCCSASIQNIVSILARTSLRGALHLIWLSINLSRRILLPIWILNILHINLL